VVSIQEDGGGALTITDQGFDYAGQGLPNSLKWKAPGLQPDTDYTVSITGVLVNGSARSFSYPLRIH
jgi:hypothetical protein